MQPGYPARIGEELLGGTRLYIVSNRGPLSIVPDEESPDRLAARRGSGGLVTALGGIAAHLPVTWVAAALDEGDRAAARSRGSLERIVRAALPGHDLRLVLVTLPPAVHHAYYRVVANPFLWFLQHGLDDAAAGFDQMPVGGPTVRATTSEDLLDAWRTGYVAANERMAAATLRAIAHVERPVIWVHDYQLYLVPALIRRARPDATIAHFTHIPWPAPAAWDAAPDPIPRAIVEGLLGADVVTLQTNEDARAFLATVDRFSSATVDRRRARVRAGGRRVAVRARPVGLDPHVIRAVAASPAVERRLRDLRSRLAGEGPSEQSAEQATTRRARGGRGSGAHRSTPREAAPRLVVRVDRLDPTKNALRGFLAFEELLERRPELAPGLRFLAVMGASRGGVAAYEAYAALVTSTVDRINARWRPEIGRDIVWLDRDGGYEHAIAALRLADVVLVNPIADGMNLVAKEAALVNERDAAIVLSRRAGAARQLAPFAIAIDPLDVDATVDALVRALDMPADERRARLHAMRAVVEARDTRQWLVDNLEDLRRAVRGVPRPSVVGRTVAGVRVPRRLRSARRARIVSRASAPSPNRRGGRAAVPSRSATATD